jgi:hypothetical protein
MTTLCERMLCDPRAFLECPCDAGFCSVTEPIGKFEEAVASR